MKTIEQLEDMLEESISTRDYRVEHGSDEKYFEAVEETARLQALLDARRNLDAIRNRTNS
jgi:hypothetical protein|tara:strand:+ start:624 stop:803 length:180 start_codon:yes stop_codon:yes gene_type:complete